MAEAQLLEATPIGRRHQLSDLHRWVEQLSSGRGRVVLIEGEPGIGKTSLARSAAARAVASGCQVFWASCDELSQAFPLLPLLDALDGPALEDSEDRRSITSILRAHQTPGHQVDVAAAAAERMLALIDNLCADAPTLLVVDDVQWADPATVLTLGRLARAVQQLPLLLVCTNRLVPRREDLTALRRAVGPGGVVQLAGLSADEVAELVTGMVGRRPGDRLLQLAASASGNPLYLTELIEALARAHALVVENGAAEVVDPQMPGSLPAVIADRLEFLSPPVRETVRAAALLGPDFSIDDLAVVSGCPVHDLLPVLDEAVLAGVLVGNDGELAFRHALIRAALYDSMPAGVRAAWHLAAARKLADDGAPAYRVARQLRPACEVRGDAESPDEWIVRWLAEAGHELVGHVPDVAIPLLRWALRTVPARVSPHDVLACRLADALYRVGQSSEAVDIAVAALPHVSRSDLRIELYWTLTACWLGTGPSEECLEALGRALAAPGVPEVERARLLVMVARVQRGVGRVDAAGEAAEEALAVARAVGDRWATGWALSMLTIVQAMHGEAARSLPLYAEALAVAAGDPTLADLRILLQVNYAVTLGDLDRYDEAIVAAEKARQAAEDVGNVIRLAQAQIALAELMFDMGRWDDALNEANQLLGTSKNAAVECGGHGIAAAILLHRGDELGLAHVANAEKYAERLGGRNLGPPALAKSLEREQAEQPAEALAVLLAGLSESAEEQEESGDLLADAVRLALLLGRRELAAELVERAETMAQASAVPHWQAIAPHCRGLLDASPERLVRAAECYTTAGRRLPRAQALEAAGVAFAERGDIAAARTHFSEAFTLYETLGASWDLARSRAAFRAYGIRRGPRVPHRASRQGWDSLTPTELKVAALVAKGMSNPEIAAQLFLSRRTVQTHVSHILAKLNLHSRIDIAREASRRDLTPYTETNAA